MLKTPVLLREYKKVKEILSNRYTNAYVTFQYYQRVFNYFINFTVSPSHFDGLMSVTIEGIFVEILKTFVDDPLKTPLKSPVLLKGSLMKY